MQMRLPGLLEEGAGRLRIYSGYSFSIPREIQNLSCGIVSGPRWAANSCKQFPLLPVILDNGAFPAWVRGETLDFEDQLKSVKDAAKTIESHGLLEYVIAPDIVGGGSDSWSRTIKSIPHLSRYNLLLPVQEGIDIEEAVSTCQKHGYGIFIGGKTMTFKVKTAEQINGRCYTHAGRVSRDGWLWTFSRLVDAVDSTTWVRSHNWNRTVDWASILARYAKIERAEIKKVDQNGQEED